jgi:hypothetical protein
MREERESLVPVVGNVFTFQRVLQMVLGFHQRGAGNGEKVREVAMRLAPEPLGNV